MNATGQRLKANLAAGLRPTRRGRHGVTGILALSLGFAVLRAAIHAVLPYTVEPQASPWCAADSGEKRRPRR